MAAKTTARYSRHTYELVAAVLDNAPRPEGNYQLEKGVGADRRSIAEAFALEFELDNPRFDREPFLKACGWHFVA